METWIIIAAIVAFFAWRMMPAKGINTISTAQLKTIINDKDKVFVDVRSQGEYKARGLKQFKNIPLGLIEFCMNELDKKTPYIMVCRSGRRSGQATAFLQYSKIISKRYRLSTQHIVKTAFFH